LSCDWYPVDPTWTKAPWPLYGVPRNLDLLYRVTDPDDAAPFTPAKPLLMVLQGFPINGVAPSFSDCRNTMYRVVIHGGAGILWWGTYQLKPSDRLWSDIKRCAGELHALEPVLEDGQVLGVVREDGATGGADTSRDLLLGDRRLEGIAFAIRQAGGMIERYAIVANTSATDTVTGSIAVLGWDTQRNGGQIRVLFEESGRTLIPVAGGRWTDRFAPNEVHVYTDRRLPGRR
jgi:hypothetical protein